MNVNNSNVQNDLPLLLNQQQTKKCHGNRRDQRFRRKCRARAMQPANIAQLLNERKQVNNKNNQRKTTTTTATTTVSNQLSVPSDLYKQMTMTMTTSLNKRKRAISLQELKSNSTLPQSTSSISIVQPLIKKMKKKRKTIMTMPLIKENNNRINKNYRRPMYLKRSSSSALFQMLSKRLNYSLKKKHEQRFIYTRLELLDRHYCLEVDLKLWQSYLNINLEQHRWPEQLCTMAQTDDFELCQQYLINYIQDFKNQINQYEIKLTKQAASYPIISVAFDQIDHCLKEFVDCQRNYLSRRNNDQLIKFKDDIQENELFETITTYYPTLDQNDFIDRLITIRERQSKIWEELLQLEVRILCRFLPSNFDQLQNFIAPPIIYTPLNNPQKAIQLNHERYKMIQEAKRTWLHIFLSTYEIKLQEFDQQYQEVLIQLESLLLNNTNVNGATLFNQIDRYMAYRTNQLKQDVSHKMSAFRRKLLQHRQRSSSTKKMIGVSPEPYLDLDFNPFNTLEWHHLSLGPSCIRSNQSALRPRKQQEIQIKNEHKDISTKVQNHLVEYHHIQRRQPIFQEYSNQLLHHLYHCYFTPLPYKDHIQAQEQAEIVASIRKKIQQHNLIIRLTDKSNNLYIGLAIDFEKKAQKHFTDTNAYIELTDNPFHKTLEKVIQLLNHLRSKKLILKWQYEEMMPDRTKTELSHLYFNPKTHKNGIPVRPIMNTIRAPTTHISKFLDKIIRPIFDDKCRTTTIIDGADLINQLDTYVGKGLLKPSTLFCTFDIHNLYTMLPQDESLNILVEFLHLHGYRKVKGISLDTIRKLASIVIKENIFVYGNKIYRQTIGGAMGSSFTLTLANIFMWKWQKEFVRQQDMTGELYGRYIDDIFMTWNKSEKDLIQLLDKANQWHSNIKLDYKISQSLPFLDILLNNNNGLLFTSVYRKQTAEPYVVPFISDHPRHVFGNIIQTALTRAIRYSSTFAAFHRERRYIKLMLLYNSYPSSFIAHQFQTFFSEYISSSTFLPFLDDEKNFFLMRQKLLAQPTPRQSQVALSATRANIDNDQTDATEQIAPNTSTATTEKKPINNEDLLIVHYTHEKRFRSFKREMHQLYENVFKNTPAMDQNLIVGNRNRQDTQKELIHKRPKPSLLKGKLMKST